MSKYWYAYFIIYVITINNIVAQNVLFNNNQGQLVDFDPDGCTHVPILDIGLYTDLASHPNGFLYALSSNGRLDQIDKSDATRITVANFPGNKYFGLTANAQGEVYAASETGELSSFNPATGQVSIYPKMGYGASGDLTYYKGVMYMSTTENTMVSIDPQFPENNKVVIDFSSSGSTIFGIVSTVEDCTIKTYAISGGVSANIYEIDWVNKSFNFVCTITQNVYGGTSAYEYFASEDPISIDSIAIEQRGCAEVDNTVNIIATSINIGDLNYSIDNQNFQTNGQFENLEFGENIIYIEDAFGCKYQDTFELHPGFLDINNIVTIPESCNKSNGSATIEINTNEDADVRYSIDGAEEQTNPSFENLSSGVYNLVIHTKQGCTENLSLEIDSVQTAQLDNILITNTFCGAANGAIELLYNTNGLNLEYSLNGSSYQNGPLFSSLEAGVYTSFILDEHGCEYQNEVEIENDDENCQIYIPNSFSPNGDGINDYFQIFTEFEMSILDFRIFDRWGNMVFDQKLTSTNKLNMGWDGKIKSLPAPNGSYSYIVRLYSNDNIISKVGDITLIR